MLLHQLPTLFIGMEHSSDSGNLLEILTVV